MSPPRPPPTHSQAASAAKAAEETPASPAPPAPAPAPPVATSSPDALSRGGGPTSLTNPMTNPDALSRGGGPTTTISPRIRGDRLKAIVAEIERENSPAMSKAPSRSFSYAAPVVVGAGALATAPSSSAVHSPTTAPPQPLSTPPLQTPAPARYGSEPTIAPCTLATASHLPSEPHSPPTSPAASNATSGWDPMTNPMTNPEASGRGFAFGAAATGLSMRALATPEAHGLMARQLDQMQHAISIFSDETLTAVSPTIAPVSPSRSAAIQVSVPDCL